MANMIARLGVLLGLDTAEFNKGLADAGRKLDAFAAQAQRGAAVAGAAFVALTTKAMAYADEIADVAKANDFAIDSIIKLQDSLASSGGKAEDAGKLLASFTNYVDKAAEGSFEAQKLFAKLGVSFQDLGKLSTEELFNKAVKGIAAIEDPLTRAAKGMEVFGKAGKGVDFVGLADGMDRTTSDAQKQAQAIEQLAALYDKLAQAGRDFLLGFIKEFGTTISDTFDYIKKLTSGADTLKNILKGVVDNVLLAGAHIAYMFVQVYKEFETIARQIGALAVGDLDKFNRLHKEAVERAKKDRQDLENFEQKILGGAGGGRGFINPPLVGGEVAAGRATKAGTNPEEEKRKREAEAQAKRDADAHRRQLQEIEAISQAEVAYARLVSSVVELGHAEERRIQTQEVLADLESRRNQMAQYDFDYQQQFIRLTAERTEALKQLESVELLPSDREARQKRINELFQRQFDLIVKIRDVEKAKTIGTTEEGFMGAAKEFFKNLPTEMEVGAAMFGSMMGNMNRALDNFVRTGKMNFKDFAKSIILDLIAIQLKAQAMKLFANLFGFGNPTTSSTGSVDYSFAGMKMNFGGPKADGGAIASDSAYMVGERGPELFVPRMSGSIIPNRALGAMGGTTNVTNYNINAIDSKSFEERLMGSSNAIWAANLYAQKRLPLGAGRM